MNCPDCHLFFLVLHRRCTVNLNGECDCPICQGLCDCKVAVREAMPRLPHPEQDGDITAYPPPGRKFGQKRKP